MWMQGQIQDLPKCGQTTELNPVSYNVGLAGDFAHWSQNFVSIFIQQRAQKLSYLSDSSPLSCPMQTARYHDQPQVLVSEGLVCPWLVLFLQ